mmetsp:Transcript_32840/g.61077  ORF Transcript_32840/g.61077 Transcript_32840/m.61077 type:complete len:206 (-) Transcript_32840:208-825(-)
MWRPGRRLVRASCQSSLSAHPLGSGDLAVVCLRHRVILRRAHSALVIHFEGADDAFVLLLVEGVRLGLPLVPSDNPWEFHPCVASSIVPSLPAVRVDVCRQVAGAGSHGLDPCPLPDVFAGVLHPLGLSLHDLFDFGLEDTVVAFSNLHHCCRRFETVVLPRGPVLFRPGLLEADILQHFPRRRRMPLGHLVVDKNHAIWIPPAP